MGKNNQKAIWSSLFLAIILFNTLFALKEIGSFDFWWWLSTNAALLSVLALLLDRKYLERLKLDLSSGVTQKVFFGLFSALLLYAIFGVGNLISVWVFSDAAAYISSVYELKLGTQLNSIVVLLALIIAPGEEIFWRGFIQHSFEEKQGEFRAIFFTAFLYTLAHIASLNPMLLAAAFVCGIFWGFLYSWKKSVLLNVISHIAWDLAVFVCFPFYS